VRAEKRVRRETGWFAVPAHQVAVLGELGLARWTAGDGTVEEQPYARLDPVGGGA
jgi:hypothetical protein